MINEEDQYKHIGSVIKERLDYSRDAFKSFVQSMTVIIGGSIWLSMQTISPEARETYVLLSRLLVVLVVIVGSIMVIQALRGWWGYRVALSKFAAHHPIPPPRRNALTAEIVMLACMIGSGIGFWVWNPFLIASTAGPAPISQPASN